MECIPSTQYERDLASSEQMEEATYVAIERDKFQFRELELNGRSKGMALNDIR